MPPELAQPVERRDERSAEAFRRIEILGRFIVRQLRHLEREMAERNYTTQEILNAVRAQKGQIASMQIMLGGMRARLNAELQGEISPKGQAILNEVMSELQGNSRDLVAAQLNNDDDPNNDVGADGQPISQGSTSGNTDGSGTGAQEPSKQLANTSLNLSADPTDAQAGETIHLSAGLSAQADAGTPPTGSVLFKSGDEEIGSAGMDSTGVAAMSIADLPAGEHSITAEYQGDDNYAASTSQTLNLRVTEASTEQPAGGNPQVDTNVGNSNPSAQPQGNQTPGTDPGNPQGQPNAGVAPQPVG